jgi:transcriptional regulator with XRE-family HTH domain
VKRHEDAAVVFGEVVKRLREERNLTQLDLADRSVLDVRTIQRVEKGESGTGLHAVFAISEGLGVNPADIFIEVQRLLTNSGR